jgi:hypothetical protein
MRLRLVLADTSRWIARIAAIPAVLLILFYLLFAVGESLQEIDPWAILMSALPFLGISVGLILAYWKEPTGSIVCLVSFLVLFSVSGILGGLEDMLDDFSSFGLLLAPVVLFSALWLLRRELQG